MVQWQLGWPGALLCLGSLDVLDSQLVVSGVCASSAPQPKRTPQQNVWTGDSGLVWHRHTAVDSPPQPTSPLSFSLFNPPPTPSRPSSSAPHSQLAAEDGFSESSWDRDQREITATSMQNVMWKPPSYVPTIDSSPSTSIPMLSVRPFLLISLPLFYRNAVWNPKRKKSSENLLQMKQKRQNGRVGGWGRPWLCLFAFTVHFVM